MRREITTGASLIALLGAGMLLTGCSVLDQLTPAETPTRDDQGAISEANENTDVFTLQVGDCTLDDGQQDEEVFDASTVPCTEPHDYEAYAADELTGQDYPGDDTVTAQADEICYNAFTSFVGATYEESTLDYTFYTPTEGSWDMDDREVLCLIVDPAGQTTGSLASAGR